MKCKLLLISVLSLFLTLNISAQEAQQVHLPNGWSLSPYGKHLALGDLPLNIAVSPNNQWMAVTNNGEGIQTIDFINIKTKEVIQRDTLRALWYGLVFSDDNKYLYASGGNQNVIYVFPVSKNGLDKPDSIFLGKNWPKNKISPAGIAVDNSHNKMYVVSHVSNSLYVINIKDRKVEKTIPLGNEAYTCLLTPDKKQLYISLWGGKKVLRYDILIGKISSQIEVGSHPNDMCQTKNGNYLFVANSDDNSVSVIDTKQNKVIEILNAALYPNAPSGSTTNALALGDNDNTLYIANADNNCLAVYDVSEAGESKSFGFIPTGWYPTNVKVIGKTVFVANGKGMNSLPNPDGPNPTDVRQKVTYQQGLRVKPKKEQYIASLFTGTLSYFQEPNKQQIAELSKQVYKNTPYSKNKELNPQGEVNNPIPMKVGDSSPIKHVFYIIKENRTYDQVLGDLPQGNGDTTLVLFGRRITPNQHALTEKYVLLDNFYVDAEVSDDGHNWSTGAYATDYLEKTWPTYYGGRGGTYDGEGGKEIANNKDGFIWDLCARNRVSFRTYGEFADDNKANIPVLKGHFAKFTSFDLSVMDTTRYRQFVTDFDSLLKNNEVPQLITLRFPNDHTNGMSVGKPTPFAYAADNDLAIGMFVEYISHSPVWKESAIFILEDDAQNGPDHVDAHRSTAYIISPYVKRNYVDHTAYSTSGMLRTIELILGMPPMTQYDAAATPMYRSFTSVPDYTPYTFLPANINLKDKNMKKDKYAELSDKLNWKKEDKIPDLLFNEILWQGLKGISAPAPTRSAYLSIHQEKDD